MSKHEFTPDEMWELRKIMHQVWNYIAGDCIDFMDDPDDPAAIAELCYDAGRMSDEYLPFYDASKKELVDRFYEALTEAPSMDEFAVSVWKARRPTAA